MTALQHCSCVCWGWDMDRDFSATGAQTEMDCIWVAVGLDAEVGFVVSQAEHVTVLRGGLLDLHSHGLLFFLSALSLG